MQAEMIGLTINDVHPLPGQLLCLPILGQYETESGLIVVKDMKKNPKIEKVKVVKVGPEFMDRSFRKPCLGTYWARPGDIMWPFRGMARPVNRATLQGKVHYFIHNEWVEAALGADDTLRAPADRVIVELEYQSTVEGSSIFLIADRDKATIGDVRAKVVAVGPEYRYEVSPGDYIVITRLKNGAIEGTQFEHAGVKYASVKSKWVEAVEKA